MYIFLYTLFLPYHHPFTHIAEYMILLFAFFIPYILEIFSYPGKESFLSFSKLHGLPLYGNNTAYLTGPHIIAKLFQKICSSNSATVNYLVAWHFTLLQVYLQNKFLEGNFLGQKIYACIFWVYTVLSNQEFQLLVSTPSKTLTIMFCFPMGYKTKGYSCPLEMEDFQHILYGRKLTVCIKSYWGSFRQFLAQKNQCPKEVG